MRLDIDDLGHMALQLGIDENGVAVLNAFDDAPPELRSSDIQTRCRGRFSRQYIVRIIRSLMDKGLLVKRGSGPRTRYALNELALSEAYLATDPLLRSDKPFRIEAIRDYVPNQSRLMPPTLSQELREISNVAIKAGDTINRIVFRRYMIDFAWASSKMEGNTYTLLETQALLEEGREAPGRSEKEARMLRNHGAAIEFAIDNAKHLRLDAMTFRGIHSLLSDGLVGDPDNEGRIRTTPVEIGGSSYRPSAIPQVLNEGLNLIGERARAIGDPYEQSQFLLVQLSYLQPFIAVNKRTARVAANLPLLKAGLCPLSFYGMEEADYIQGLLAYYEVQSPALLNGAYEAGYRAAAKRYRTYGLHLGEQMEAMDGALRKRSVELIKRYMRAVVAGDVMPAERDEYLRAHVDEADPQARDMVVLKAAKALGAMDRAQAIALKIPLALLQDYYNCVGEADRSPDD